MSFSEEYWKFDTDTNTYEVQMVNISSGRKITTITSANNPDDAFKNALNQKNYVADNWAEGYIKKLETKKTGEV